MEKGRNCSRGAISSLIHNILLPDVRLLCLNKTRLFLRDERLFEINEVEIMRVDCNFLRDKSLFFNHLFPEIHTGSYKSASGSFIQHKLCSGLCEKVPLCVLVYDLARSSVGIQDRDRELPVL